MKKSLGKVEWLESLGRVVSGKTTMILQYIKENLGSKRALYVSADDMYFGENRLLDLADVFYKNAGEYLFIDEIHKYPDWSQELKNIYDSISRLEGCIYGFFCT